MGVASFSSKGASSKSSIKPAHTQGASKTINGGKRSDSLTGKLDRMAKAGKKISPAANKRPVNPSNSQSTPNAVVKTGTKKRSLGY